MSNNNNNYDEKNSTQILVDLVNHIPYKGHVVIDALNDFVLPETWSFYHRVNTNYHLAFVKSGRGFYDYHGRKDWFEPGKLYLFARNCPHSRYLDLENLPRMTLIRFDVVDHNSEQALEALLEGGAYSCVVKKISFYYDLIEKMLTNYRSSRSSCGKTMAELSLTQMIYQVHSESLAKARKDPRLERACDYIEANYMKKLYLVDMAKASGLSRNYFLKLFKESYKTTPKQYQINVRVQQGLKYLLETEMKISEIAFLLGYEDQFVFSKQFKELIGLPPSGVRKHYIDPSILNKRQGH